MAWLKTELWSTSRGLFVGAWKPCQPDATIFARGFHEYHSISGSFSCTCVVKTCVFNLIENVVSTAKGSVRSE
jgi:hypothetical protein